MARLASDGFASPISNAIPTSIVVTATDRTGNAILRRGLTPKQAAVSAIVLSARRVFSFQHRPGPRLACDTPQRISEAPIVVIDRPASATGAAARGPRADEWGRFC